MIWPFVKRKHYVTFGGQQIEVPPLSLEGSLELILLMSPYIPLLEYHLPEIQAALKGNGNRPRLLSTIFFALRREMSEAPGDITKMIALLAGIDPVWLAETATGEELVEALPVLDKAHNLGRLWGIAQGMGLHVRYEENSHD